MLCTQEYKVLTTLSIFAFFFLITFHILSHFSKKKYFITFTWEIKRNLKQKSFPLNLLLSTTFTIRLMMNVLIQIFLIFIKLSCVHLHHSWRDVLLTLILTCEWKYIKTIRGNRDEKSWKKWIVNYLLNEFF